jgi:hypothetical protein
MRFHFSSVPLTMCTVQAMLVRVDPARTYMEENSAAEGPVRAGLRRWNVT